MSSLVATHRRAIPAVVDASALRFGPAVSEPDLPPAGPFRKIATFIEDAALLLFVVLMIPVSILLIGAIVGLFARALVEITRRF
jgi:hypothetical protein